MTAALASGNGLWRALGHTPRSALAEAAGALSASFAFSPEPASRRGEGAHVRRQSGQVLVRDQVRTVSRHATPTVADGLFGFAPAAAKAELARRIADGPMA